MQKAFVVIIGLLPLLAATCKHSNGVQPYLQGKIIRITCASKVIQVLNTDTVGDMGWKNTMAGEATYDHVFKAANPCDIPSGLKEGDVFYFKTAQPGTDSCMVCMMYDAPPKATFKVTAISTTNPVMNR